LQWCRETVGGCRRPWGIDHFDLVVAVRDGTQPRTIEFKRLRPFDLYHDGDAVARLHRFLAPLTHPAAAGLPVAVALFSWGDAVHAALPPAL
jgi:hypothetical protein